MMSKEFRLLLELSIQTSSETPGDIYIGPLNSLSCCAKNVESQAWSLEPNFANAALHKAHWLSYIHSSYDAISNMKVSFLLFSLKKFLLLATSRTISRYTDFTNSNCNAGFILDWFILGWLLVHQRAADNVSVLMAVCEKSYQNIQKY